jgi:hypothetical protein
LTGIIAGLLHGAAVRVGVGVRVGVSVGVLVAVRVGVSVGVLVAVSVGDKVGVRVAVGVAVNSSKCNMQLGVAVIIPKVRLTIPGVGMANGVSATTTADCSHSPPQNASHPGVPLSISMYA